MKKALFLFLALIIIFSGCIGQKTVKKGDNVTIEYIASLEDGEVLDTSNESVAIENNLSSPGREFKPLIFIVGKGDVIKGLNEGVLGMKVGESKILRIPPEKAYGPFNPDAIGVTPIIQHLPVLRSIPKITVIPLGRFEILYGKDHKIGEDVQIRNTNINMTIQNITSNVTLSYNITVGYKTWQSGKQWNETVVKIDDKNITLRPDVKKNDTIQLKGVPWNATVVDIDNESITMRNNAIPDTVISSGSRNMKISFNETSIIIDENHKLAGNILIFNITLKSIGR